MSRFVLITCVVLCSCGGGVDSADGPAVWELEQALQAGEVGGSLELTNVFDLVPAPDGRVFLTQWSVPTVTVVDRDGRPHSEIGRHGSGPGEFAQPSRMGWLGDTLWVAEMGEIEFFTDYGEHLGRVGFRETLYPDRGISYGPGVPLANGLLLGTPSYRVNEVTSGDLTRVPLLLVNRAGELVDSVGHQELTGRTIEVDFGEGGGGLMGRHPLPPTPDFEISLDGEYWVRVDQPGEGLFRVTKVGPELDTIYSVDRPYEPVEPDAEWFSSFVDQQARPIATALDRPLARIAEGFREALDLEVLPPVMALVAGIDGTVWLKREPTGRDSTWWEVLGPGGALEAMIEIPDDVTIHSASREAVWGVRLGQYDEPIIVRYLVRGTGRTRGTP